MDKQQKFEIDNTEKIQTSKIWIHIRLSSLCEKLHLAQTNLYI